MTVPIQFGVNILPLDCGRQPGVVARGNARELSYAYEADRVECGSASLLQNRRPPAAAGGRQDGSCQSFWKFCAALIWNPLLVGTA